MSGEDSVVEHFRWLVSRSNWPNPNSSQSSTIQSMTIPRLHESPEERHVQSPAPGLSNSINDILQMFEASKNGKKDSVLSDLMAGVNLDAPMISG
jgi:hypothetical protein